MPEFHETRMGREYYECWVPHIATSLRRIAEALEKNNKDNNPEEETKPEQT